MPSTAAIAPRFAPLRQAMDAARDEFCAFQRQRQKEQPSDYAKNPEAVFIDALQKTAAIFKERLKFAGRKYSDVAAWQLMSGGTLEPNMRLYFLKRRTDEEQVALFNGLLGRIQEHLINNKPLVDVTRDFVDAALASSRGNPIAERQDRRELSTVHKRSLRGGTPERKPARLKYERLAHKIG